VPHLVVAVTPDGEVVLRSNVSPDVLRSFGEDLKNIADELTRSTAMPKPSHKRSSLYRFSVGSDFGVTDATAMTWRLPWPV